MRLPAAFCPANKITRLVAASPSVAHETSCHHRAQVKPLRCFSPDQVSARSWPFTAGEKSAPKTLMSGPGAIESFLFWATLPGSEFTAQNHLCALYIDRARHDRDSIHEVRSGLCIERRRIFPGFHGGGQRGIYDIVMVVGVEKMTCQPTPRVTEILAGAGDCATEVKAGSTFPSLFATIARRHMHDFGTTREHLSSGCREEPRERRSEPRRPDAEGNHARTGYERPPHCRTAESLRLFADQRWSGRSCIVRSRSRAGIQ